MAKSLKCGRFQKIVIISKNKKIIILSYLLKLITYFFERFFKEKFVYVYAYLYVNIWDDVVRLNNVLSKFIFFLLILLVRNVTFLHSFKKQFFQKMPIFKRKMDKK